MVEDAGFHGAVRRHIRRSAALVAVSPGPDLLGGLLFGAEAPAYHVHWLVVSEQARGKGVGRALMEDAMPVRVRKAVPGKSSAGALPDPCDVGSDGELVV